MGEFDRTESSYIERKIDSRRLGMQLGRVSKVTEHTESDDDSNHEVNVILRNEDKERRRVPILNNTPGSIQVPEKDDLVVVGFLDGASEAPIVLGQVYSDVQRAPLGTENMYRLKRGNLYLEFDGDEEWARISHKDNDDDTGDDANARVEIDDSSGQAEVTIEATNADVNIHVSGGTVKIGDENGTFQPVARQGDSVEVSDPDSGTITGQITGGSNDVEST